MCERVRGSDRVGRWYRPRQFDLLRECFCEVNKIEEIQVAEYVKVLQRRRRGNSIKREW